MRIHRSRKVADAVDCLLAAVVALATGTARGDELQPFDFAAAKEAFEQHCGDCHADAEGEGGFSLEALADAASLKDASREWIRLRHRLADGSMPPRDAEPLALAERKRLVAWLDGAVREALCQAGESAGPAMFRRLTAYEYSNTMRDLLAVHFLAGRALPQDVAGGEGFDNARETLGISPIYAEKFLEAATTALEYAASNVESRGVLVANRPSEALEERSAAEANLGVLANRAFRRPVAKEELQPYVSLFVDARADGLDFDQANFYAMRGVLTSPQFLFLSEATPAAGEAAAPLDGWELATRLSYFLWTSLPDGALREAADGGKLADVEEVRRQTLRMLGVGTHLNDSLVQFVGQWLGTADLGSTKEIDATRHPRIKDNHVSALRNQGVYVFESLLRENGSLLELIDADWTFLNEELVAVYGIDRKKLGDEKIQQQLVRVKLPEEYRYRGGLLGSGGVLARTSYPQRSSAVLRGVWVWDKMLGVTLPPPPPNVPALPEHGESGQAETQRQRLNRHREDPTCASCHDRIDPIGFALENFDEIGRWRDVDEGGKVDAVAELGGGMTIEGIAGLKAYLLENKDQFVRHLTEKMLGYALARGLEPGDRATVETIVARLRANDYRAQELVLGIVESKPFRFKGARP